MASRVVMPKLSDTMEEGVLLRWYKREGEAVESGDAIAEIETDKAIMDLEAYASGILRKILAPEGAHVQAGGLIAVIGQQEEDIEPLLRGISQATTHEQRPLGTAATVEPKKPTIIAQEPPPRPESRPSPAVSTEPRRKVKASPLARKLAAELGVDLTSIQGTGPQGRITRADVEKVSGKGKEMPESTAVQHPPVTSQPISKMVAEDREVVLSSMRRAIARKMMQSKAPVPHFYVTVEVDMGRALELKDQLRDAWGEDAPSITGLILKACAVALQQVPAINASFMEDRIILHSKIHLGIAVGLDEGLIVPVLHDCESKRLRQLASEADRLIAKARTRRIRPEEYTGATFSVSNLGMFGVEDFIAVITPPEAAALAVGKVWEKPVVRDGKVVPARVMRVTLSCDHRIIDGVQAARFLEEFRKAMEQPFRLLAENETFPKDPKV